MTGKMRRGDAAMWVLTKIAMVFFIISLAAILLVFSGYQKESLCSGEGRLVAGNIASALSQLLNTPLEDERRIVGVEPAMSIGDGVFSRYKITLTKRDAAEGTKAIMVDAQAELNPNCAGGARVTYPTALEESASFHFIPEGSSNLPNPRFISSPEPGTDFAMILRPSVVSTLEGELGKRTTFITLIKCTEKKVSRKVHYIIQDCTRADANDCLNLDSGGGTAPKDSQGHSLDTGAICGAG